MTRTLINQRDTMPAPLDTSRHRLALTRCLSSLGALLLTLALSGCGPTDDLSDDQSQAPVTSAQALSPMTGSPQTRIELPKDVQIRMLRAEVRALTERLEAIEAKTASMHTTPTNEVVFSGVNVRIEDPSITQAGRVGSGVGNLILGGDAHDLSGASHNLILGEQHRIRGTGNITLGDAHDISATGTLTLGAEHTVRADHGSITGGRFNTLEGEGAHIGAGENNRARAMGGAILAGRGNEVSGGETAIIAGENNHAGGTNAVVVSGRNNHAAGAENAVIAGEGNTSLGARAMICGKNAQLATSARAVVACQ